MVQEDDGDTCARSEFAIGELGTRYVNAQRRRVVRVPGLVLMVSKSDDTQPRRRFLAR